MLNQEQAQAVVNQYPNITAITRTHMLRRLMWCQYDDIAEQLLHTGSILDIGSGFGHFGVYLSLMYPDMYVYGCDPDARKTAVAQNSLPASGKDRSCEFFAGTYQEWESLPEQFDSIVILDVLYLMPLEDQEAMLAWVVERLRPEGRLVIKTIDPSQGFKSKMAILQEWVMVCLLRKTFSSGAWAAGQEPSYYMKKLKSLGMNIECRPLVHNRTPAVLLFGRKKDI